VKNSYDNSNFHKLNIEGGTAAHFMIGVQKSTLCKLTLSSGSVAPSLEQLPISPVAKELYTLKEKSGFAVTPLVSPNLL
jgi:hypothetical protein